MKIVENTWTATDIVKFPGEVVANIINHEYKSGNKEKAKELLSALNDVYVASLFGAHGFTDLKERVITNNDLEFLDELNEIAPKIFSKDSKNLLGGVSVAVLTNGMEMLEKLLKSGAKIDGESPYGAKEHAVKAGITGNKLEEMTVRGFIQGENTTSKSALFWAATMKNAKAVEMILKYVPDTPYIKYTSVSDPKSRSGSRTIKVESENVWAAAVHSKDVEVMKLIFNHYKPLILDEIKKELSGRRDAQWLEVMPEVEKLEVWNYLMAEENESYIKKAWADRSLFRRQLMSVDPDRYISLYKKFGTVHPDANRRTLVFGSSSTPPESISAVELQTAVMAGALKVVQFLAKENPLWVGSMQDFYPGKTRRMVRQRGLLALSLVNGHSDVAEYLSSLPGVFQRESPNITLLVEMGWMFKEKDVGYQSDVNKQKEEIALAKNGWERIKLMHSASLQREKMMEDRATFKVKNKTNAL